MGGHKSCSTGWCPHSAFIVFFKSVYSHCVCPTACERNVDMVFMLDQSGSVGATNHDIAIQFIRNVVSFFSIGLGSTRVGLIAYSTNAYIEFDLNDHTTLSQLQNAIVGVNYRGGWTATALALNAANFLLEPNNNRGARDDSDGVPKIAVLITGVWWCGWGGW